MLYLCQLSSSLYLEEHFSKFSMKVMKVTKPEKEMFSCLNLKILSAPKKIVRECLQFTIFFLSFFGGIFVACVGITPELGDYCCPKTEHSFWRVRGAEVHRSQRLRQTG